MLKKLLAILMSIQLIACATVSTITSEPPGATIRINGIPSGQTPATFTFDDGFWNTSVVELTMPGYRTEVVTLNRRVSVPRLIVGICVFWPLLLWVAEHQPVYYFELEPDHRNSSLETTPGYLAFKAEEPGIDLRIDGREVPPDHVIALEAGEHDVRFVQDGLEVGGQAVEIHAGELTQLFMGETVR